MPFPTKVSDSFRRLNPAMFDVGVGQARANKDSLMVRQHTGDGMNKTERAWFELLKATNPKALIYREVSLPLANGCKYRLDFLSVYRDGGIWTFNGFEVKGRPLPAGIAKLKIAASLYPWIDFTLVWRKSRTQPFEMQKINQ